MGTIYLIYDNENSDNTEVIAVFDDAELAKAFTDRHPRFYGCYRIEEKTVNPFFETTDKWLYLVIIDGEDDCLQVHQISSFDEEQLAYHNPVSKHEEAFYMYLFAVDKNDALLKAKMRFEQMKCSGEWLLMKDETD